MSSALQLRLLGTPVVTLDGVSVAETVAGKTQAALFYLAVTGQPQTRSALAGLLWGDIPEASARSNLRKILAELRRTVGAYLDINRHQVAFKPDSDYWVDVVEFDARAGAADVSHRQAAVELYRSDFLTGFYVRHAPDFENWMLAEQARLREAMVQTLHTLTTHFTEQGDLAQGIAYTHRLLALEPWREAAHRQLMLLLAQDGQRSAALAQYEICCRMLAEELDVEPGPETVELYEHIRDGKLSPNTEKPRHERPSLASVAAPPFFLDDAVTPVETEAPVFVARQQELTRLNGFLDTAVTGQCRVAFIIGEAGQGKTALLQAFARQAQETHPDLVVAGGNCNAYTGPGDPYLPFREILELLSGDVEARAMAGALRADHARRLWHMLPTTAQALVEIGPDLLDTFIPAQALLNRVAVCALTEAAWSTQLQDLVVRKATRANEGNIQQNDLFEQYLKVVQQLAGHAPLLLFVDDLQWADVGSTNLLFHLGRRLAGYRVLIVGAYRPSEVAIGRPSTATRPDTSAPERHPMARVINEFQREFGDIILDLNQAESRTFVDALLDSQPNVLAASFRDTLHHQTGGHPLFTIELLRSMQDRGGLVQDAAGFWAEQSDLDWKSLPARVEGVIAERVSRLAPPQQELLQIAAVEGEEFTAELVAHSLGIDKREMVRCLSGDLDKTHRLVQAVDIKQAGPLRLSRYRFRHNLIQHYLYNNLDTVERAHLHEAVGLGLEQLYAERTEEIAVQLARHFQEAEITEKAVDYLLQAGKRAARLSAHEEAITHLTQGLDLLETLPNSPGCLQKELSLRIALGNSLTVTKGHADPVVEQVFSRARALCQQVAGDSPQLCSVLYGLWLYYRVRAQHQTALELGNQLLKLAQSADDPTRLLVAHKTLGATYFNLGDFVQARFHLEQGLAHYNPQQHRSLVDIYAEDVGAACYFELVTTMWILGYPDQALALMHKMLTLAQTLAHAFTLAGAMFWAAFFYQFQRQSQSVWEQAEATLALSTEQGFSLYLLGGTLLYGWALAELGQPEEGIAHLNHLLTIMDAGGIVVFRAYILGLLAEAYGYADRFEKALDILDEAFEAVNANGEHVYEAELYRLRGNCC